MTARNTNRLLEHQESRQAGHEHRPHHRRRVLAVHAVALQRSGHRLALFIAETLGVVSDFGSHLLAVVGERHELHRNSGKRGIGAESPQRPERLRRLQRSRLHLETFFGATAEDLEEQFFHGAEVVVHQLGFQPGLVRKAARRHRRVALIEQQLLGRIEQQAPILRVRRPDPAGRCHALAPCSRSNRNIQVSRMPDRKPDRVAARPAHLDPDITAVLSRCSALHGYRTRAARGLAAKPPSRHSRLSEARTT